MRVLLDTHLDLERRRAGLADAAARLRAEAELIPPTSAGARGAGPRRTRAIGATSSTATPGSPTSRPRSRRWSRVAARPRRSDPTGRPTRPTRRSPPLQPRGGRSGGGPRLVGPPHPRPAVGGDGCRARGDRQPRRTAGVGPQRRQHGAARQRPRPAAVAGAAGPAHRWERRRLELAEAADEARALVGGRVDPVTGEPVPAQVYTYDPDAFGGRRGRRDRRRRPGHGRQRHAPGARPRHRRHRHPRLGGHAADVYDTARTDDPSETDAVAAWIGYDAPGDLGGVVGEDLAHRKGGGLLADDVDGLRAGRDGPPAHVTVVGHSYGSTTVGHAAHDHHLAVDDIVLVGSPGVGGGNHHATDLGVGSRPRVRRCRPPRPGRPAG